MPDEVIALGGGLDDPNVRLTQGDTAPVRVHEGGTLESRCYLENDEISSYQFTWVSRSGRTDRTLTEGQNLRLTNVNADTFRDPIYCLVERIEDGEIFEKQINVEYCKTVHDSPTDLL